MWLRDEYLALDRISEREREARIAAQRHGLAFDDRPPLPPLASAPSGRRLLAGAIAAAARGAFWLARQVDASIEPEWRRSAR